MFAELRLSLSDMLGRDFMRSVCEARAALTGEAVQALLEIADKKVDFYPASFAAHQEELMQKIGKPLVSRFPDDNEGAPTGAYKAAQKTPAAPLSGLGAFRLGEDGRLYFIGKSEHYQSSLGHHFPGYRLVELAKELGVCNATHNNTRGYITRILERQLVATANGLEPGDPALDSVLKSDAPGALNTVINLETGSLAVEAALKMMFNRFYSLDGNTKPQYEGRVPVFLVMADHAGGPTGNYHGTTVMDQTLRGLWPGLVHKIEGANIARVVPVPINDADAFEKAIRKWNEPPYKTAGFCHEIILMNYGSIRLQESYLQKCYKLCRETDTPVMCDEIQSGAWYEGCFLFRRYGIKPDFVSAGKGFPGGEYASSRMIASSRYATLSQFGALVTNGQGELSSLCYLITMAFIRANGKAIEENGKQYYDSLTALAAKHGDLISGVEGQGLMSALCFKDNEKALSFSKKLNSEMCVDASVQSYKPNCPPVVLTKLPLITTPKMIPVLIGIFDKTLEIC